jgi:hypothetical protein
MSIFGVCRIDGGACSRVHRSVSGAGERVVFGRGVERQCPGCERPFSYSATHP